MHAVAERPEDKPSRIRATGQSWPPSTVFARSIDGHHARTFEVVAVSEGGLPRLRLGTVCYEEPDTFFAGQK